jgi:hypothetical protein
LPESGVIIRFMSGIELVCRFFIDYPPDQKTFYAVKFCVRIVNETAFAYRITFDAKFVSSYAKFVPTSASNY